MKEKHRDILFSAAEVFGFTEAIEPPQSAHVLVKTFSLDTRFSYRLHIPYDEAVPPHVSVMLTISEGHTVVSHFEFDDTVRIVDVGQTLHLLRYEVAKLRKQVGETLEG